MPCPTLILTVLGTSMAPAIPNGGQLAAEPVTCNPALNRGDIITFHSGANVHPIVKRIIAGEGDSFALTPTGNITVNNTPATTLSGQPYALANTKLIQLYATSYNGKIPPNTFLVMGEDPHGTTDSSRFGLINRSDLINRITGLVSGTQILPIAGK